MYKSDVDYSVEQISNIETLNQRVDDLRIGAMANLEELVQTLQTNRLFLDQNQWKTQDMIQSLGLILETLAKEI